MPIYEYKCQKCGHDLETLQQVSEPPLTTCPECGGELKKLLSAPAFQFKGSGWYVTDYAGKKNGGSGESESKGKDKGSGKEKGDKAASSGTSEAKSDTAKKTAGA